MSGQYIQCPTCEMDASRTFLRFGPADIVSCAGCSLVYVNPQPPPANTTSFFAHSYICNEQRLRQQFGSWRVRTLARIASVVKQRKHAGKILDIGCAGGDFLMHFDPQAWDRCGIELSLLAADTARQRGLSVHQSVIRETDLPNNWFDVISCLDTFYYFPTPRQDLMKINQLLRPDGLLVLEMPGHTYRLIRNVGPVSLVLNWRWCHMNSVSRMLFYYSQKSLAKLLDKTGFRIEQVVLEQAPLQGGAAIRLLNNLYFAVSRAIFRATLGAVNLAPKTVYVCRKVQ